MLSLKTFTETGAQEMYTTNVSPEAARVCVFLVDPMTLRPLCEAAEL